MSLLSNYQNSPVRKAIGDFLHKKIYSNSWIYLDLWSVVHFAAGFIVMLVIIMLGGEGYKKYLWLLGALVLFEILEFIFFTSLTPANFYFQEKMVNTVWDIIIGLLGGVLIDVILTVSRNMN